MSVRVVPRAICATVDTEHGQMTAASGKLLPLAGGAARSSAAYTSAATPARSRKAAVTASRPCADSSSSCSSTSTPLSDTHSCSSHPAAASAWTRRSTYGAPLAPLTPTNTVDGGDALMAGNSGRSRPPSVDGAGVALATVTALRPRSVVAVALHAHAAIAEHRVGVVVLEGRTVRQGHAVTRAAERAAVALGADTRRRGGRARVRRDPAGGMRHLQAVALDAAVLAVALDALLGVVQRVVAVMARPAAGMRHRQSVAADTELGVRLEVTRHADGLAPVEDDAAVDIVPTFRVRHLQPVVALGAEGLLFVAAAALRGRDVQAHGDLGRGSRHAADVTGAARVGQLFAVVAARADRHLVLAAARHLEQRARVRDVGVAGQTLVARFAQALVVAAALAHDQVLLDLGLGMALHAVGRADIRGDRPLVLVGDVQDEVAGALQVADEVVEHARLGVALLAAHAGAIVRGLLVGGHLGFDDVAHLAGTDAVQGGEADDGGYEEHAERHEHAEDPPAGDTPFQQNAALGGLALSHGSLPPCDR